MAIYSHIYLVDGLHVIEFSRLKSCFTLTPVSRSHNQGITILNAEASFLPTLKSIHEKFPKLKVPAPRLTQPRCAY